MLENNKNNNGVNNLINNSEDQKVINNTINNSVNTTLKEDVNSNLEMEIAPKNNNKLILKITFLVILLVLSAWLIVFFFQEDDSDDILSNLNINGSGLNVVSNTEEQDSNISDGENIDDEETLGGDETTAIASDSKPITVVNDDYRMALEAPEQSVVITKEDIPANSITIIGSDDGFSPDVFYVSSGQEITLTLTANSASPVVLTFYDERMAAVAIGCSPGTTRFVTFKAPTEVGEYLFVNDVFGKREQQGKMVVR